MTVILYLPVYINHLYRQCMKHWMKRQVRTKAVGIATRWPYCLIISMEGEDEATTSPNDKIPSVSPPCHAKITQNSVIRCWE